MVPPTGTGRRAAGPPTGRSSSPMAGSTTRAASTPTPPRPRRPDTDRHPGQIGAPSVVPPGPRDLHGPSAGVGQRLGEHRVGRHPPSTARTRWAAPSRPPPPRRDRHPVGHTLEHRPDQLRAAAPAVRPVKVPGRRSPTPACPGPTGRGRTTRPPCPRSAPLPRPSRPRVDDARSSRSHSSTSPPTA